MRLKILLPLFAAAALLLGTLSVVRHHNGTRQAPTLSSGNSDQKPLDSSAAINAAESKPANPDVAPTATPGSPSAPPDTTAIVQDSYVDHRISELEDLAWENDAHSLQTILSELTNRDRRIRKAALQAAVQFASRDALPALADAAAQTEDPDEKAELTEAIDYLKLPSLTEVLAQQKSGGAAPAIAPAKIIRRAAVKKAVPVNVPN
jgi:hypothetical protein